MADHAVGGVDRLVDRCARQAGHRQPEGRRDDAVGKILRQALDGGAADGGLVQRLRVAADDPRHRLAAGVEAARLQRPGYRADMLAKAALRQERGGEESGRGQPRAAAEQRRDRPGRHPARGDDDGERDHAAGLAPRGRLRGIVQRAVESRDQPPDPRHRMADGPEQTVGITDRGFGQQRQECEQDGHGRTATPRRIDRPRRREPARRSRRITAPRAQIAPFPSSPADELRGSWKTGLWTTCRHAAARPDRRVGGIDIPCGG